MQDNKRDTDVKNRLLDYVGEGEGGMIWESSIETCILPLRYSCLENPMDKGVWRAIQSRRLQRVGHN